MDGVLYCMWRLTLDAGGSLVSLWLFPSSNSENFVDWGCNHEFMAGFGSARESIVLGFWFFESPIFKLVNNSKSNWLVWRVDVLSPTLFLLSISTSAVYFLCFSKFFQIRNLEWAFLFSCYSIDRVRHCFTKLLLFRSNLNCNLLIFFYRSSLHLNFESIIFFSKVKWHFDYLYFKEEVSMFQLILGWIWPHLPLEILIYKNLFTFERGVQSILEICFWISSFITVSWPCYYFLLLGGWFNSFQVNLPFLFSNSKSPFISNKSLCGIYSICYNLKVKKISSKSNSWGSSTH